MTADVDIIGRRDWGARPPAGTPSGFSLPAPRVWLHHGAAGSSNLATARQYVRHHIESKGWLDIGYSFLIAEGKVLEGRGPGRAGAHTGGDNRSSHGICMVGNYTTVPPATRDLDALRSLLTHGAARGWWPLPLITGGHRDAPGASTRCPGDALYRLIGDINRQTIAPTVKDTIMALTARDVWREDIGDGQAATYLRQARDRSTAARDAARSADGKLDTLLTRPGVQLTDAQVRAIGDAVADRVVNRVADAVIDRLKQRL